MTFLSILPVHVTFAVVDLETFGARSDPDQQWLRERMYDVLASSADRAGIPWTQCHAIDRGDGVALLIPASVSKPIVAEGFVRELLSGLLTHNRRSRETAAMRMRMSLHAGEASDDGNGWVGTELNTACRLVDLPALRQALLEAPTAPLALCVSDLWYQTVVRHDPGLVDHRTYNPIVAQAKEFDGRAWLHIPDLAARPHTGVGHDQVVIRLTSGGDDQPSAQSWPAGHPIAGWSPPPRG